MPVFGLQIPNFTFGVADSELFAKVREIAQTAEGSGFSSVWVMDHFYQLPALGGSEQPMLEAYTLLGALAASTTRVRLGTLVTGVTYRNPALLAKIITTLDVISGGRAILGIGAAWHDVEHEAYGFEFPPVGERMGRLEEALQICRAMFRDDSASFSGRYYRVVEARNVPRPIQPGGPKIMVGGGGEKRTLRLVAQYADACNVTGDPETIRHKIDVIQRHCKDVGREASEITITRMATLVVTNSAQETAEARAFVTAAAGEDAVRTFNIGVEDEVLAQVTELAEAGVDEFIFNMPLSDAAGVRRAGDMLTGAFG